MERPSASRWGVAVVIGAALVGVALAVQALWHGGAALYRNAGVCIGLAAALPLALALVFGFPSKRLTKRLALSAVAVAVTLAVLELALGGGGRAGAEPRLVADERLGFAYAAGVGGFDGWGFRNAAVPERADVVVVGDSQAFGAGLQRGEAIPARLAAASGLDVYGMSLGGYGPLQYLALVERALELEPRAVAVVLYLGNDLVDAYRAAALEAWSGWRDPAVTYPPPPSPETEVRAKRAPNWAVGALEAVLERSAVLSAATARLRARAQLKTYFDELAAGEAGRTRVGEGDLRTVLTPRYRTPSVNLARPQVADGLRLTERALAEMAAACNAADARLGVVLLPTKEAVYADFLRGRGDALSGPLTVLRRAEGEATERVRAALEELGIAAVDAGPALRASLEAGNPVWPSSGDGHLSPAGAERVAALVKELLELP